MKLEDIETAIKTLIEMNVAYLKTCEVISSKDLGDDGLLTIPPAVRILFAGATGGPVDSTAQSNSFNPRFALLAIGQNLRGPAQAKHGDGALKGAYDILDDLRAALPGSKLTLGTETAPVLYRGEDFEYAKPEHTVCSMLVEVQGYFVNG